MMGLIQKQVLIVSFHWLQRALEPFFRNIRKRGNGYYSCAFNHNVINMFCIREGGCCEVSVNH